MSPRKVSSATTGPAAASPPSATRLEIEVVGEEPGWTVIPLGEIERSVAQIAHALARTVDLPAAVATATLALSGDNKVRDLNHQWRGLDKPTNVLSFPSGETVEDALARGEADAGLFLGDIIIAEETLTREALDAGIPPTDHFLHLALHGMLHLLGYDHETDAEADAMEALETAILATLGVPDPYAGTEPADAAGSTSGAPEANPAPRA